jgi:hypothetical protein
MKKLKFKLDALREEMEILNMGDLISTKGGGAAGYYGYSTWEDFVYAVDHGDVPDGSYFPDGVSGGYGVHGDYGNLPYLHLDAGYGTWNAGGYGASGGYGGYGGHSSFFHIDSSGIYLLDTNCYISESGMPYNKVSFDGGATWQNQLIGGATSEMPHYAQRTSRDGLIENLVLTDTEAIGFFSEMTKSDHDLTRTMWAAGVTNDVLFQSPVASGTLYIKTIQDDINLENWEDMSAAYTGGGIVVTKLSYWQSENSGITSVLYTVKDRNGNELGKVYKSL